MTGKYFLLIFVLNCVLFNNIDAHCENQIFEINCPKGQYIHIKNILYGRDKTSALCSNNQTINLSESCLTTDASNVEDKCNNKEICTIFVNGTDFLNPCPANITTYLRINYTCSNTTTKQCGRHEYFASMVCNCEEICPIVGQTCAMFCKEYACACKSGFKRDPNTNRCVLQQYCPSDNPEKNHEHFSECANHQATCLRFPFFLFSGLNISRCYPGYACIDGYERDTTNGNCVLPDQCSRPFPRFRK